MLFFFGLRAWRTRRLITSTATSAIAELRPGFAEVKGRIVAAGETFQSPMTEKRCVYYRFQVQERKTESGDSNRSWVTVVDDERAAICKVDDGTGLASVDLPNAEVQLDRDSRLRSGFLRDAPPELARMLQQRYGTSTKGWLLNKMMRYSETILEEGDELFVIGRVSWRDDGPFFVDDRPVFIVSDQGESRVQRRYLLRALAFFMGSALALSLAGFGAASILSG